MCRLLVAVDKKWTLCTFPPVSIVTSFSLAACSPSLLYSTPSPPPFLPFPLLPLSSFLSPSPPIIEPLRTSQGNLTLKAYQLTEKVLGILKKDEQSKKEDQFIPETYAQKHPWESPCFSFLAFFAMYAVKWLPVQDAEVGYDVYGRLCWAARGPTQFPPGQCSPGWARASYSFCPTVQHSGPVRSVSLEAGDCGFFPPHLVVVYQCLGI